MKEITGIERLQGKAAAELWRGSGGWPKQSQPCELEPPIIEYDEHALTAWDRYVNEWDQRVNIRLPVAAWAGDHHDLRSVHISQFSQDETTIAQAQQFLQSLSFLRRPASFEVRGFGGDDQHSASTACFFICQADDAVVVQQQLQAHYPNSSIELEQLSAIDMALSHTLHQDLADGMLLRLSDWHVHPLATLSSLKVDPLSVAIAALDNLGNNEQAMLQVLFTPVQNDWAQNVQVACRNPYLKGGDYIANDITTPLLRDKFTSPLFAVSVRLVSTCSTALHQLTGWAEQFANPPQAFSFYDEQGDINALPHAIGARCTYRPGIILNAEELAGLVHLPTTAVISERLVRITTKTNPAPPATWKETPGCVYLGINMHRGKKNDVHIPGNMRPRHCYIAGASGTGKSTLLLNMIDHDIEHGCGIGLLDPHGDLVDGVLSIIPEERLQDVVYFNPADKDYPPAFNILQCYDDAERERSAGETVGTISKFFPGSWGVRMNHILVHALLTITKAKGATLFDVRRILVDANFRYHIVAQLRDENLLAFWNHEFPNYPQGVCDPILNKLSPFLINSTIRNIICQRQGKFNFDAIINGKKIFLANLSTGMLGEATAGMLGTFIMSKIVNAAFRRAAIPESKRVPFYLYVDEFQNFMDLAVGFEQILAEARKYKLVLAGMANQYVGQLSDTVRQAIFGNVGTLLTFRLGVQDAQFVSNEFGEFTRDEILSLEMGQAIVRIGGTQNSFNLKTPPPPLKENAATRQAILKASRQRYTTPRAIIEKSFRAKKTPPQQPAPQSTTAAKKKNSPQPAAPNQPQQPTTKPSEDISPDLVDDDLV